MTSGSRDRDPRQVGRIGRLLETSGLTRRDFVGNSARFGLSISALAGLGLPATAFADDGEPVRGGTLVILIDTDPSGCNPAVTTLAPSLAIGVNIYEGLTRIDQDFKPVPHLAESWDVSPDGRRYTLKLVEAKWQDGEDLTSSDVKFSLEEVSATYGAKFKAAAGHIESIETPDPRTVVFNLDEPFGPFLFSLSAYSNAAILPEHVFKGTNVLENPASLDKPVGTGPFLLKEWVRGAHVILERNPNYWKPDRPYLDQIVLKQIPDPASRVLVLKAGEVDYSSYFYFPKEHIKEVVDDPRLQIREQGIPQNHLIVLNNRRAPFDNPKVRQALFTALSREYIKKVVYQDQGKVMKNHIDSRLPWAHDPELDLSEMYPHDPERAKAMLDEAGLEADSSGKRFDVHFVFDAQDGSYERMGQVVKSMWGKIGVNVVLDAKPREGFIQQAFVEWDYDAYPQAYTTSGDPALGISRLYVTSAIEKRPYVNASGYSNPEVDKLFEAGGVGTDPDERGKHYKALARILADDLPLYPMWETAMINVATKRVRGKWAWGTGYSFWEEVWVNDA